MLKINKKLKKKWKVVSLFTGIGAWEKAMSNLGINYDLINFCEIDKWAETSYCAIHGVDRSKNLGNITDVSPVKIKDFDILVYSPPCFKAGTLITTKRGLIPIENVEVGDYVLTHKNRFKKVLNTMIKHSENINEINIQGCPSTFVTNEHPYYVRTLKKILKNNKKLSKPYWKKVEDLKEGDFIGFAINQESENPKKLTKDLAYKFGLELYEKNTNIPSYIINLPKQILTSFLKGYLSKANKLNNAYIITTYDSRLAYQLGQIIMKAYGVCYNLSKINEIWRIEVCINKNINDYPILKDGIIWYPFINKVNTPFNDYVYNLEVDKDNSYVANNAIVHNCQAFSVAGKQMGFDDKRGILFFDALRIIQAKKPKYALMENVKGLTGKKFEKEFNIMLEKLEQAGYNNYYKVLNAKDYGIPQNRERVFIVSIRKDIDDGRFEFPEGFDNGLRLKHMLENNVDDKYYISNDRCENLLRDLKEKEFKKAIDNLNMLFLKDESEDKIIRLNNPNSFSQKVYSKEEIAPIITTACGFTIPSSTVLTNEENEVLACLTPEREKIRQNGRRFKESEEPMFALTAQDRHGIIIKGKLEPCILRKEYKADNIKDKIGNITELKSRNDGTNNAVTTVLNDNLLIEPNECKQVLSIPKDILNDNERQRRVYSPEGISPTVLARNDNAKIIQVGMINMKGSEQIRRVYDPNGIAPTLDTCQGGHRQPKIICDNDKMKDKNSLIFIGGITEKDWAKDGKNLSRNFPQGERVYDSNGIACSQTAQGGETGSYTGLYLEREKEPEIVVDKSIKPSVAKNFEREKEEILKSDKEIYQCKSDGGWQDNKVGLKVSPTIRAGNNHTAALDSNYRIRKLTPLECWRLMGFDDADYLKAKKALEINHYNGKDKSNSQMYKQAGNSIVVKTIEELLKKLPLK